MSHKPTQSFSYGATGSTDDYDDATLILADSQGLTFEEDRECIANFDLDLLASQLWPDEGGPSHPTSSGDGGCHPHVESTFFLPQEDDFLNLGSINPDEVLDSRKQQTYSTTTHLGGYQNCEPSTSSHWYQPYSDPTQYGNLSSSIEQMTLFQDYTHHATTSSYNQQTCVVGHQDQPLGLSASLTQHPGVSGCDKVATIPNLSSGGAPSSKKQKGYRHRHQRQFLGDEEAQRDRSRVLNNEASAIYRKKMRDLHSKAEAELDLLESRNQQLSRRFRILQKFCAVYRSRLEALNVPAPNSF